MHAPARRWVQRAAALVVAGGMAVAGLAVPAQAAATFTDVPVTHQFRTEIIWLDQANIANGYSDGSFRPTEQVSRQAFAAFLYRLAGRPNVSLPGRSPFSDVPTSHQFYREIVWLSKQGITNGWSDGTFRPALTIDRNAMAAFLYRYEGRPSFSAPSSSPFRDMTPSSAFYKEVTWLKARGITNGYTADKTFRPHWGVSREATAAFLYRLAGRPDVKPVVPSSFAVNGAGFGHGVGMSQYGAEAMARAGKGAGDILRYYYQGTDVTTVDADQDIRVEIFGSGSDSRNSVDLVARGDWRLRFYNQGSTQWHDEWKGEAGERLHVTRDGNTVKVTRDGGESETATKDVSLHWESTRFYKSSSNVDAYVDLYRPGSSSRVTHGSYRHGRIFVSVPSTSYPRLIVANEVKLNTEYLYGIAEIPSSWDLDARQAQAIVARGYAIRAYQSGKSTTCNCHIYDDTRDQNFSGWRKESEGDDAYYGKRWVEAVDRTTSSSGTRGKVLTYDGRIARTYYFSSSGGQTENSDDIWVAAFPYLRSVDDPWSEKSFNRNTSWTQTLTQSRARSIFGLSDVVSIKVTSRTAGGSDAAATRVTATSSTGKTSSITGAENIRSRIAQGKSPWIWSFTPKF